MNLQTFANYAVIALAIHYFWKQTNQGAAISGFQPLGRSNWAYKLAPGGVAGIPPVVSNGTGIAGLPVGYMPQGSSVLNHLKELQNPSRGWVITESPNYPAPFDRLPYPDTYTNVYKIGY